MNTPFPLDTAHRPERIGDAELGNLLAGIGNHENKALLIAAMVPGVTYDRSGLQTLFNEMQGSPPAWHSNDGMVFSYCLHSLAPIGLVAKEIIDEDRQTVGFIKTDYGVKRGDALAGHLLDFSLQHSEISLQQIFGRTSTSWESGARSPMGRVAIFGELLTQVLPTRISDLVGEDLNGNKNITSHIHSLAVDGLISVISRGSSDPLMKYALGTEPFASLPIRPSKSKLPSDIRDVVEMLLSAESEATITTQDIISHLHQNPDWREYDDGTRLIQRVNEALRRFIKHGAVKKAGQFTERNRSLVSMTEEQESTIEDCLDIIYSFQDSEPDFLATGRELARQIIADQDAVNALVGKARKASPFANRRLEDERGEVVSGAMFEIPEATVNQIEQHLLQNGIRMSQETIRRTLLELEEKGLAAKATKNKKAVWGLTTDSSLAE